jgi:hypothetical protein
MPQQSIRFSDEQYDAIKAEAERRGKPYTFSSVLLEWAKLGQLHSAEVTRGGSGQGVDVGLVLASQPAAVAGEADAQRVAAEAAVVPQAHRYPASAETPAQAKQRKLNEDKARRS